MATAAREAVDVAATLRRLRPASAQQQSAPAMKKGERRSEEPGCTVGKPHPPPIM
jgi:hypothetical protein